MRYYRNRNPCERTPAWVTSAVALGARVHESGEHGFHTVYLGEKWLTDADTSRGKLAYGDDFSGDAQELGEKSVADALKWLQGKKNPRGISVGTRVQLRPSARSLIGYQGLGASGEVVRVRSGTKDGLPKSVRFYEVRWPAGQVLTHRSDQVMPYRKPNPKRRRNPDLITWSGLNGTAPGGWRYRIEDKSRPGDPWFTVYLIPPAGSWAGGVVEPMASRSSLEAVKHYAERSAAEIAQRGNPSRRRR